MREDFANKGLLDCCTGNIERLDFWKKHAIELRTRYFLNKLLHETKVLLVLFPYLSACSVYQ